MVICEDASELKIIVRCVIVACKEALTIDELWQKVLHVLGGPHCVQLSLFGFDTVFDYLKSIPDVVQLEDPEDENSLVNLVSSKLSRNMELLVSTNIIRERSINNKIAHQDLLVPYRIQCAFIRVFVELYPKGLPFCDFVSNILSSSIFNSFGDNYEALILNLDHIFKRSELDIISLRPTLVNSLKKIKEDNKFTATDIFNIDKYALENKMEDRSIAIGLEYPLFNILEEPIKNNIELLLDEENDWISERKICDLYTKKFGSTFAHYRRWGFSRVSQLFAKLPELCYVNFLENDIEIISAKIYSKYIQHDVNNLIQEMNGPDCFSISNNNKSENQPKENIGVLEIFLKDDKFLKASLNDCFLDQKIQHIDLKINQLLNVYVSRVDTNFIPSIICQSLNEANELQNLLTDMKQFYLMNESEFVFNPTLTLQKHVYAVFLDEFWFRGIIIDINLSNLKIVNIDNGLVHKIPNDDIRILCKKFAELPAQSFTCHLHGIDSIDEDILSQIVNKKCTINIVSVDQHNKSASVKIKLMNSTSNEYLNDEWIKYGFAVSEYSSNEA